MADYLYDKGKAQLPLGEIFRDTGLDKLNWDFRTSPDLGYTDPGGRCWGSQYAIDLVTDLVALILESKKSGGFELKELFGDEGRDLFIEITTTLQEDQSMDRALAAFCADPLAYDLYEMVGEEELREMAQDCEGIRKELCAWPRGVGNNKRS